MPYSQYMGYNDPLEAMYPKIYYKIQPEIYRRSDRFFQEHGPYYTPSYDYIGEMVNEIVNGMEYNDNDFDMDMYSRQFSSRNLLTTLVTILLLGELTGRRRRHFHGHY